MQDLKEAAKSAIMVQSACNLSGVIRSFVSAIDVIIKHDHQGTDYINRHPICILYATQVAHLTGQMLDIDNSTYDAAYNECERIACS